MLIFLQYWLYTAQHTDITLWKKKKTCVRFSILDKKIWRKNGEYCLPLSSTSCSWYFLRRATSFLYFSKRSLLSSDISFIATIICCNIRKLFINEKQQIKCNYQLLDLRSSTFSTSLCSLQYLFLGFFDSCSIEVRKVADLAAKAGIIGLHGA